MVSHANFMIYLWPWNHLIQESAFTSCCSIRIVIKSWTTRKATTTSPPRENDFVEKVVAPRQEAFLYGVRSDAQCVALLLYVHLYAVQQVFDWRTGLPGPKGHHRLLICFQAADGVLVDTKILLCSQHTDHDGRLACSHGLSSGNTDQDLEWNGGLKALTANTMHVVFGTSNYWRWIKPRSIYLTSMFSL